jgi:hypothetical protein
MRELFGEGRAEPRVCLRGVGQAHYIHEGYEAVGIDGEFVRCTCSLVDVSTARLQ